MESWLVIRRKRPLIRRHVLVLGDYLDARQLLFGHVELFEFTVTALGASKKNCFPAIDRADYTFQIIKCEDNMKSLRHNIKLAFTTCALGHTYVVNDMIPMYRFLKEWYVQNYLEVYRANLETYSWEIPHVIVFDLDSTLITDERDVNIRDQFVYESLIELKRRGCVLILWSYGNREHVTHSLKQTRLTEFFDITICGGHKIDAAPSNRRIVDVKRGNVYVETSFYLDDKNDFENETSITTTVATKTFSQQHHHDNRPPKSPRIALWYMRRRGINNFKSITLVDDLKSNDYSYDYFVNVRKCPEPRNDWQQYHDQIIDYIDHHETVYSS